MAIKDGRLKKAQPLFFKIWRSFEIRASLRVGSLVWMASRHRELARRMGLRRFSPLTGIPYPNKWACSQAKFGIALASHQCGPGSSPENGIICELSLLLVFVLALRFFFSGSSFFLPPQKQQIQLYPMYGYFITNTRDATRVTRISKGTLTVLVLYTFIFNTALSSRAKR